MEKIKELNINLKMALKTLESLSYPERKMLAQVIEKSMETDPAWSEKATDKQKNEYRKKVLASRKLSGVLGVKITSKDLKK